MNIQLEPDQYRKLIELVYLGEWMVNAQHDVEFQDEAASDILQLLLAVDPLPDVERDAETGDYFMREAWLARLYDDYILDYDDHVFWDELTERLAQRDLARARGVTSDDINRDDDLTELRPIEARYRHELESNGVDRLEIGLDF